MRRPPPSRAARLLPVVLIAGSGVAVSASPATAHTSLIGTTPKAGAQVTQPLDAVQVVFDQAVSPRSGRLVLTAPDGSEVAAGAVQLSGGTVTRPLRPLTQGGRYVLAYRVVAQDGHPLTGQVPFTVAAAAVTGAASPAAASPPTGPAVGASEAPPPGAGTTTEGGTQGGTQGGAAAAQPATETGGGNGWLVPGLVAVLVGAGVVLGVAATRSARRVGSAAL